VTRGPGPSLCLSLSWEPTVTTAVSACPEVDDRSFVSAVNTPSLNYGWIPAKQLKPGMRLKTSDCQTAVVVGGSVPAVHDGWMWDLTVPGNNDHDFYVGTALNAGVKPLDSFAVLVHNSDCGPRFEVSSDGSVRDLFNDILHPNGSPIGEPGTSPDIREIGGDPSDAQDFFDTLAEDGNVVANNAKLTRVALPDGGFVQLRTVMSQSPNTAATIDINMPGTPDITKLKFNP
jgi:hypothetical protein